MDQTIFCRGCGQIKPVSDKELDAEWERNKQCYPGITREQTLNCICFCSDCAGLNDDVTVHVTTRKTIKTH